MENGREAFLDSVAFCVAYFHLPQLPGPNRRKSGSISTEPLSTRQAVVPNAVVTIHNPSAASITPHPTVPALSASQTCLSIPIT